MYPLKPFKLSLPIRQRTSVQSDALRKKESPQGHDFMKWADADSVINIISHVYAYAQTYMDPGAPGGKEYLRCIRQSDGNGGGSAPDHKGRQRTA